MKYAEHFYAEFAKYVQFKQECWYVNDELSKWTEKQFLKQGLPKPITMDILSRLQQYEDSDEARYLIDLLKKNENAEDVDQFEHSEIIDSDYCKETKNKKKRKRRKTNLLPLITRAKTPKRSCLVKGFLPIEKYLAKERSKNKNKVTYKSMEKLDALE